MVILVIGGSYMPALIQSAGVVAVGGEIPAAAGEIPAAADRTLAVSDFDQGNLVVHYRVVQGEIHKIAEGVARMVELGDRFRVFIQGVKIRLEHIIIVAFLVRRVIAALKSI